MDEIPQLDGAKVLIVHEDAVLRSVLKTQLSRWGAKTIREAKDTLGGVTEISLARRWGEPISLMLVGSRMADRVNTDIPQTLQPYPEELERLVLLLDAEAAKNDLVRLRNLGVRHYLIHPFEGDRLRKVLCEVAGVATDTESVEEREKGLESPAPRILLVEDSPEGRVVFQLYLADSEFQIEVAPDGRVALERFRLELFDLVLMDLRMPGLDGYGVAEAIRGWEREKDLRRVPIVALTGFSQTESIQRSLRAGFDAYLVKPVKKDALLTVIRQLLARGRSPLARAS